MSTMTLNPTHQNESQTVQLHEHIAIGGRVDRQAGVLRNVLILGRHSKNGGPGGREYSDAALREAVPDYEGVKVLVNHPDRHKPHAERSVRDVFGVLRNVHVAHDGLRGNLHYHKNHADAEFLLDVAESAPSSMGLSHNATGDCVTRNGKQVVTKILSVRSVDLVENPAHGKGLFESALREDSALMPADADADLGPADADKSEADRLLSEIAHDADLTRAKKLQLIARVLDSIDGIATVSDAVSGAEPPDSADDSNPAAQPAAPVSESFTYAMKNGELVRVPAPWGNGPRPNFMAKEQSAYQRRASEPETLVEALTGRPPAARVKAFVESLRDDYGPKFHPPKPRTRPLVEQAEQREESYAELTAGGFTSRLR